MLHTLLYMLYFAVTASSMRTLMNHNFQKPPQVIMSELLQKKSVNILLHSTSDGQKLTKKLPTKSLTKFFLVRPIV